MKRRKKINKTLLGNNWLIGGSVGPICVHSKPRKIIYLNRQLCYVSYLFSLILSNCGVIFVNRQKPPIVLAYRIKNIPKIYADK